MGYKREARDMIDTVSRGTVAARPTLVVAAHTTWPEFPGLWRPLLDEVWAFLRSLDESFEALSVDLESIEEVGKLVVARVHIHVTERAGGAESDFNFSSVGRFAQGKIARVENYLDHDEAMNDAELRAAES